MRNLERISNPFGDEKVMANCGLFGMMSEQGRLFNGRDIIQAMANMHDRGNGLGGGFAAYGIYPEFSDAFAFHVMFNTKTAREETERFLSSRFHLLRDEEIPTRSHRKISDPPILWRFFVEVKDLQAGGLSEEDYVVRAVMYINERIDDAFVFSSGKNMGVFKGVGYPEDIGEFFCLDEYEGYLWTAHGRFPTNTQGWWGGAHPFSILDLTVVHNGEISSYGTNRNYLEMYDYRCTMHTDTEVVAYAADLLLRRHQLPIEVATKVMAPPLWKEIDRMPEAERHLFTAIRQTYGGLLMNGPFTFIIAREGEMVALGDRIRLRPLVAGRKGDLLFVSSEEASIYLICPDVDETWIPRGGEPVIGRLRDEASHTLDVAELRR